MNIGDEFKRAFVRRIVYVIVALALGFLATGRASAAVPESVCYRQAPDPLTCDEGEARSESKSAEHPKEFCGTDATPGPIASDLYAAKTYRRQWVCNWNANGMPKMSGGPTYHHFDAGCATRNASLGNLSERSLGYGKGAADQCLGGCKYKLVSGERTQSDTFSMDGNQPQSHTKIWGIWEFPGDVCTDAVPAKPKLPPAPETDCTPSYMGVVVCDVAPDDKKCMTMSSGRFACWGKDENGTKTDGAITQTKSNSPTPPPPPEGSTKTVTTTTTNNNTTTNITNYSTNNGSPAGPTNQGEGTGTDGKPTGTGGAGGGGAGEEENPNDGNASGDCATAPVSVGDKLLGAILRQEWDTGCKVEKAGGKLEGDPNCNDGGVVAFACSGNQLLCKQTLTALEAKCQALDAKNRILSDADKDQGNAGADGEGEYWSDGEGIGELNGSLISVGGSGEFVPVMSLNGRTVDLNGPIGNMLAILKLLIIAACSAAAAFIAGGRD